MLFLYVGLLIRLIVIFLFKNHTNYDIDSWLLVGRETLAHHSIYPEISILHHPYFPVMLYYYAVAEWLTRCGIPFTVMIKLLFAGFDLAICYLIYLISDRNKKMAWIYAINPVSIIITCVQGQFDSIPLFFLLLSLYHMNSGKAIYSVLSASGAIALKTWPAAFLIALYRRITHWRLFLLFAFIPAVTLILFCLTYWRSPLDVLMPIAGYRGVYGVFGLGYLMKFIVHNHTAERILSLAFLLSYAIYAVRTKSDNMYTETLLHMLFFFSFTVTFGVQWLMWLVPFLVLGYRKEMWLYLLTGTAYLTVANMLWWGMGKQISHLPVSNDIAGMLVWFAVLYLFFRTKIETTKVKKSKHNLA